MMFRRHILVAWLALTSITGCFKPLPDVRDGDVIFQTSRSSQSVAIQQATHSKYSHMGIVFIRQGQPYVLEAAATVRYSRLGDWIARGVDQAYIVKRLRAGIGPQQADRLRAVAATFVGRCCGTAAARADAAGNAGSRPILLTPIVKSCLRAAAEIRTVD